MYSISGEGLYIKADLRNCGCIIGCCHSDKRTFRVCGKKIGGKKTQMDKIVVEDLDLFYGNFQALKKINVAFKEHEITALIGPSGCGKSTLLKTLNRMNDLVEGCHIKGLSI